ncbi:MAG: tripartite tricarboxylate transporter substrate binding protein [Beijerinckiaceae bacterium]|nr:tripartite tricarboxylate transporter substrate binding protein [Beijerinckiaceae bacterium]
MDRRTFAKALAASAGAPLLLPFAVRAQGAWPQQAVRIIVPFAAGGSADVLPRIVADALGPVWKQPIIIENRTGAGGNIGAEHVAQSKPDGYTLMSTPAPPLAVNQNLYPKLNFDPTKFKPITILATSPNVVGVSNKLGVNSVKELIEKAKANEGKLNVANQGNGSTSHLTAAMFESRTGVKFNHVPYRGTAPALNDLVAGHVDIFFDNISSSLPQHLGGNIKILAVAQKERASQIPDVPTVSEAGIPDFNATAWFAVVAPEGTPDDIIARINKDIVAALNSPDVRRKYLEQAATPVANSPAEAAKYIADETKLWGDVIRTANVKLAN